MGDILISHKNKFIAPFKAIQFIFIPKLVYRFVSLFKYYDRLK